jgi:hypothetical protein
MTGLDPAVAAAFIAGLVSIVVALISAVVTKAGIEATGRDTTRKLARAAQENRIKLFAGERDTDRKLAQASEESQARILAAERDTDRKLAQAKEESRAKLDQEAQRLRREFQLEFAAETAAKALLEDRRFEQRTFTTIKRHLRGFEDDELRKLLVRAGAVCFESQTGDELWGLLERNRDKLGRTDLEHPGAFLAGLEQLSLADTEDTPSFDSKLGGFVFKLPYPKLPKGVIHAAPAAQDLPRYYPGLGEFVFPFPHANSHLTQANPAVPVIDAAAAPMDEIAVSLVPHFVPVGNA